MSTDAIVLLKQDHKEIRKVFRDFEAAGPNATVRKGDLVAKMIELLTVHTYIENEVMYPRGPATAARPRGRCSRVLRGTPRRRRAVHGAVRDAADAERFDAKTTVLIENVTHHIEEEEDDWFPTVRAGLGRKQLSDLGARMLAAKDKAPRSPAQPSALKKTIDAVIK